MQYHSLSKVSIILFLLTIFLLSFICIRIFDNEISFKLPVLEFKNLTSIFEVLLTINLAFIFTNPIENEEGENIYIKQFKPDNFFKIFSNIFPLLHRIKKTSDEIYVKTRAENRKNEFEELLNEYEAEIRKYRTQRDEIMYSKNFSNLHSFSALCTFMLLFFYSLEEKIELISNVILFSHILFFMFAIYHDGCLSQKIRMRDYLCILLVFFIIISLTITTTYHFNFFKLISIKIIPLFLLPSLCLHFVYYYYRINQALKQMKTNLYIINKKINEINGSTLIEFEIKQ